MNALSDPGFRLYYAGAVAGVNGNWIFRVVLAWLAWDISRSPAFVGLIAATSLGLMALTTPIFGALADRGEILRAYRRVLTGMLAAPLALLGLLLTDMLGRGALFGIAVIFGLMLAAYHPVRQSIGPRLVAPPLIGSVVALAALNFNVGRLVAPAIGGFLISHFGTAIAAAVATALFLPALVIAPMLRPRMPARRAAPKSYLSDLREGIAAAWQALPIRNALLLTVVALGPIRAITEILALIADGRFRQGAAGLGLLSSAVGAGALTAALFQVAVGARLLRARGLRHTVIALGFASTLALTLAPGFGLAIALAVPVGFAGTYIGVSMQTAIQSGLDDALRGRVMSLWLLSITLSTSVLAFATSALSEWIGLGAAATGLFALAALLTALAARHEPGDPAE